MGTALDILITADVAEAVNNINTVADAAAEAVQTVEALPPIPDQTITVDADTTQPASDLSDLSDLSDKKVTVTADTSQAVTALDTLPQVPDQTTAVDADTSQAASAIDALPQATDRAITVTADASQAVTALDTLPQVDDQTTTVDADTSQAAADLAEVSDKSDIPDKKFSVYANVKPALADLGKVARLIAKNAAAGAKWAATQAANALKWAVAGSSAALAAGGVALTKYGSRAEDTRLAFRTMLGSMADGDAMMAKLDRFSNSTPYSGDQVNQAAKTLLAFGVAAGDVENTLRKVGDVAAGSGKDFNELSAIYGKVFAKGVMDTEAMNQMVEAGIPIVKTLGAMFGKSGQEIYAMAEKGEITAAAVDRAFAQMSGSGGVFSGMMQKQSETVSGMWGAITGQIAYAASNIGEALLPMLKVVLGYFQSWADKIAEMSADGSLIRWFGKIAVSGVTAVGELIKWSVTLANHFAAAFKTIAAWGKLLWNGLKTGLMAVVTLMVAQFEAIVNVALAAYNAVVRFFGGKGKEINWTWTKASAGVTADTAKETAKNYREATDGRFFAEAMTKNQSFDAAVNKAVSSINNRLSAAVDQAAETQAKRTADIDKKLRSGTIPDEAKRTGTPAQNKAERADVDQLARVGLYNFSNNDVRSLDIERNNLIRKLLKKDPVKLEIVEV